MAVVPPSSHVPFSTIQNFQSHGVDAIGSRDTLQSTHLQSRTARMRVWLCDAGEFTNHSPASNGSQQHHQSVVVTSAKQQTLCVMSSPSNCTLAQIFRDSSKHASQTTFVRLALVVHAYF
eukprot:m.66052 g.66052  ORF g.66052 m.66052 type:complete len:120 (-) comp12091_c1_seq1:2-361(-)